MLSFIRSLRGTIGRRRSRLDLHNPVITERGTMSEGSIRLSHFFIVARLLRERIRLSRTTPHIDSKATQRQYFTIPLSVVQSKHASTDASRIPHVAGEP